MTLAGIVISVVALFSWRSTGFRQMEPEALMRIVLPAATLIEVGIETVFASFFMGILKIKSRDVK